MSFFDNLMVSKLNAFADWFGRLVVINILIILCSLPIITIIPSLNAGYSLLHDYVQKKNPKLFKDFFKYFKISIGKKIVLNILYITVIGFGFWNVMYYSEVLAETSQLFYQIGYFVTLALLATFYALVIYSVIVLKVLPETSIKNILKISLVIAGKFYLTSVALIVLTASPVLMIFNPITAVFLVFIGVSLPLLLNVLLTRPTVFYLEGLGGKNV